jgi:Type IV pilin-like G and H, putative
MRIVLVTLVCLSLVGTFLLQIDFTYEARSMGCSDEGRVFIGVLNREQQLHYEQFNSFNKDIKSISPGAGLESDHYRFSTKVFDQVTFQYGIPKMSKVLDRCSPRYPVWGTTFPSHQQMNREFDHSYVGVVWVDGKELRFLICQTVVRESVAAATPIRKIDGSYICANGTR